MKALSTRSPAPLLAAGDRPATIPTLQGLQRVAWWVARHDLRRCHRYHAEVYSWGLGMAGVPASSAGQLLRVILNPPRDDTARISVNWRLQVAPRNFRQ